MDFTFDNPFDDVFTDPNAPATIETAPVVVQPVQAVQPAQNPPVAVQQFTMPPSTMPQPTAPASTTTNPPPQQFVPQTTSPVLQNPAVIPQQMYTAPPVAQNPAMQPATVANPITPQNTVQQPTGQVNQVPTQQFQNPALANPAVVQQSPQTQQPAQVTQTPVQMPVQTAPQVATAQTTAPQQTAPATAPAPETAATNPNDIWREAKAPNGRIYYYKKSTRETTWTKPASYIPLGGTAPVSSAGGAAPGTSAAAPATSTTTPTATSTNTPLTGFNLSSLSSTGTTPTSTPLSASASSDNPALAASNPALMGSNPALGGVNPALGGTNPALNAGTNPALNASNPSLGQSSGSLGASNPSLPAVGGVGTEQQVSNPQLLQNPGFNPALNPALGGMTPSSSNPAFGQDANVGHMSASNSSTDVQAQTQAQPTQQPAYRYNPATGQYEPMVSGDASQFQNGQAQQNGHFADANQIAASSAPQTQQVQQVMYDENGQVMYDANGQVMYTIVEVPIQPATVQDPNAQMYGQQGQYGQAGAAPSDANAPVAAATASAVPSSPSFPKTFRVRLPNDQRQVVPFKAESTLRSVLTKICGARGLSMDDYLAKDRSGMDISLEKTLGEINQEEISFLTPRAGIVPQDETKRKAHKIMSDIYEANAGLSSSLQAIIKNYRDPLLKSAQDVDMRKRLLTEQECNQIFASLESITSMTKDFMSHMSTQLSVWPVDLTEMITRHSEVLTFYNEFVNNYRANMNKLEDLRRNPDFAAFVDGVQRSLGSKLRLEDFMALPAVKIAATSVLMEALIGVLTDQHPNFFMLRDFHQRLQPIANQATSLRLQMEARSKIVHLEATIAKFPKKASFLHDQRIFFRDGLIEMGTKKKPSLCYIALFTDLMIVCKAPEKKKKDKPATPPTFEEVIAFGPSNCTVEEVGSQGWNLHIDAGKGKFTVVCTIHTSSEASKADWVKSFKDAFHDFTGKPHLKPPVL